MRVPRVLLVLSAIGAGLATWTSLCGILVSETYARETRAWAVQAMGQDVANLPVAAVLLWSAARLARGSLRALYLWLGCLLYFIYAFAIYAFSVHFNACFLAYVGVLGSSFYSLVGTMAGLHPSEVTSPLRGHPHATGAGNLLIVVGVMFGGLWLAELVPHLIAGTLPPALLETALWTNPVHVLDLAVLLPAMILVGVLLRTRHVLGLLWAVPLLVFAATMGTGILAMFGLSAMNGLPVAAPAATVTGVIVLLSALYTWRLLRWPAGAD